MTITSSRLAYTTASNTVAFTAPAAGTVLYVEARRNSLGDTTSMGLTGYGSPIVNAGPGNSASSNERVMAWWKVSDGTESSVTFTNMSGGTRAIEVYSISTSLGGGTWRLINAQALNSGSSTLATYTIAGFKSPCEENIRLNQWIWSSSITSGETMTQSPGGWTTASVDRFNGGTARQNVAQDNLLELTLTNDLGSARRWAASTVTLGYVVLPTIAMTSPAAGAVSGTVSLTSTISGGNVAIERTRFFKGSTTQLGYDALYVRRTSDTSPTSGKLYHVIYMLPSDQPDRQFDTNGSCQQSVQNVEAFLDGEISKHIRVARTSKNVIHVSKFRSSRTKANYAAGTAYSLIVSDLQAAGFNDSTNKNYIVFFEGVDNVGGVLGRSNVASTLSQSGIYVAIFLHSTSASAPMRPGNATKLKNNGDNETYWPDTSLVHELFHSLGAVNASALNDDGAFHVTDSINDIMGGNQPGRVIDINNDDYYNHTGGWLDTADSAYFMTPQEFVVGDWQGDRFAFWDADSEAAGTYSVTSKLYVRDLGDQITSAAVSYTKSGTPPPPPASLTGFKKRNFSDTGWLDTTTTKRTGVNTWV